jgi:ATP-dependent RNA helicase DDX55/SPB4
MKDWDDLAEDERLYKKFKKGKISKEEYNKLMMKNI